MPAAKIERMRSRSNSLCLVLGSPDACAEYQMDPLALWLATESYVLYSYCTYYVRSDIRYCAAANFGLFTFYHSQKILFTPTFFAVVLVLALMVSKC